MTLGLNTATINQNQELPNNSATVATEPSNDDNSFYDAIQAELGEDEDLTVEDDEDKPSNDDGKEKKEPENKNEGKDDAEDVADDDGSEVEIPEKFKTKDGNLNLKALSKYIKDSETNNTQLRQKISDFEKNQASLQEKADLADTLQKQQDELAKQFGFENYTSLQERQKAIQKQSQIATFEANAYAEYLALCENPQEMRDTLIKYASNPNDQTLIDIINEGFPIEAHKNVAMKSQQFQTELAQHNLQLEREATKKEAEAHINSVVAEYGDWFKNKEFANVYALAFQYLGIDLDPQKMFPAMEALKNSWIEEYKAQIQAEKENEDAIEGLQSLSPNSKQKPEINTKVDLNKISQKELDNLVGQLI